MAKLQNCCELVPATPPTADASGAGSIFTPEGLALIQTKPASGSSSVSFTGLGNYPYTNYKLIFTITLAGSATPISVTLSTNNGGNYISGSGYLSGSNAVSEGSNAIGAQGSTTGFQLTGGSAASTFVGNIDLFNINSSAYYVSSNGYCFQALASNFNYIFHFGVYQTLIVANALQISSSATTFTGNFSLYGFNG